MRLIVTALLLFSMALSANARTMEEAISDANAQMASMGMNMRIGYAEYLTAGEGGEFGRTVFFDSQCGKGKQGPCNRQLSSDWVAGDPRREWNELVWGITDASITTGVDINDPTMNSDPGNTLAPGADFEAYHNANATWEAAACSEIPLVDVGDTPPGLDLGLIQFFEGFGGSPLVVTDLLHAGMLSPDFFDQIACGDPGSGCGANILGVTFTLIWIDPGSGEPTDVDNNGKTDAALREIYYNENFPWQDNPDDTTFDGSIDLESVALHEMGHGLSQAHFGQGFFQDRNRDGIVPNSPEEIILTPSAVMNAAHTNAGRELTATDLGGHCSNWSQWPSN